MLPVCRIFVHTVPRIFHSRFQTGLGDTQADDLLWEGCCEEETEPSSQTVSYQAVAAPAKDTQDSGRVTGQKILHIFTPHSV